MNPENRPTWHDSGRMKHRVYAVIKDQSDSAAGRVFTALMSVLIIVNIVFVLVDTMSREPTSLAAASRVVEVVSVAIFTIEYLLRLWTADLIHPELRPWAARGRYVVSGMAIIDLLSILPFYLPAVIPVDLRVLRILRLVRLVRVFKLGRYSTALAVMGRVFRRSSAALVSAISVVCFLLIVSSVLMYYVENPAQPGKFTSAFSALWWAVSTITTVGYGDVYPVTAIGKVLGSVIELLGVALVAVPTGIISAGYMSEIDATEMMENPVEQSTKLEGLLNDGLLTRAEFDTCKQRVVSSLTTR